MPKLNLSLRGKEYTFLRAVANGWDIDLQTQDAQSTVPHLVEAMQEPENIRKAFHRLPQDAQTVIQTLLEHEGRIAWGQFTRQYGELRQMGAGKFDRERPDRNPASPVEVLWYRGMIHKAFFDLPPEPQEFAYIPDELIETFSELCSVTPIEWGRAAEPDECAYPKLANDEIINYATDYLAANRTGIDMNSWAHFREHWPPEMEPFIRDLLYADYLLDKLLEPSPDKVRDFLMSTRGAALGELARAWMRSKSINELKLLPSIIVDDDVENNPHGTRQAVLDLLKNIPGGRWWNLESFIQAVHDREPDFQRPGGSYKSWYIKDRETNTVLSGFMDWDEVDGALLHFLITGPMHWLGYFDLASNSPDGKPTAFRYSRWSEKLMAGESPEGLQNNDSKISVGHAGIIHVPVLAPRWLRYQIARFCEWQKIEGEGQHLIYQFRVSPNSLSRANTQSLKPAQLLKLLQMHAESPPPQGFEQAMENWEKGGTQAVLQSTKLLRFSEPEMLQTMKKSDAAHFIREQLNDTTIVVSKHNIPELIKQLTKLGILVSEE